MQIEFLYFEGCPSHEAALARLQQVLCEADVPDPIQIIAVETDEAAQQWQFHGSPTIRFNGQDIDPLPTGTPYALACRAYHHADGRITPLPTVAEIAAALAQHIRSDTHQS